MIWNLSKWGWRLIPGGVSALAIGILLKAGMIQPLENAQYQVLFQLRGMQPWDERLVLVAIDEQSLAQIGRFPWSRQEYVQLLQVLSKSESSIVAFDLLFSESSAEDSAFAEAIAQQGHVILAQAWDADAVPLQPVPILQQHALGIGHISTRQDSDGIVRRVAAQIDGISSLSITAVQAYSLLHEAVSLPTYRSLWLNWAGSADSIQHYSFVKVVQGEVSPQVFSNKIVLVGVTAAGIDPLVTPFDRSPPTSSVILHATLIQNLLQQSILRPLSPRWVGLLFLVGGPLLSWILLGYGWLKQVSAVAGLWAGWIILSVLLLRVNVLPPVVSPLLLFLVTGSTTGVCDRLRESAALRHQLHHLQEDKAQQEEFLRTASHELRTPVANIQNVITLLRIAKSPEDWEEYLRILEEECRQESALINDLLDFQRIGNSSRPTQLESFDLKDWLSEVMTPFLFRAEVTQHLIQVDVESGLPPLKLDWLSFRRIVTELLNNACKYTPLGEIIQVTARVMAPHLELVVSNSGVTMPPEELAKIFEPFYRNVDVDHRQEGGTGLGLAIIQKLTEYLGGEVQVANQKDVITFTVRLPVEIDCSMLLEEMD